MPLLTAETVHSPLVPEAPFSPYMRLQTYVRTPEFGKLARYVAVSGISTVVSLAMLYLFYRPVGLSAGWANVVATVIATVPSYYLNRTWAWQRSGRSHFRKEVLPFWVIALVSLGLSTLAVRFAAHEADQHLRSHTAQTLAVLLANFFTYGVMWVGKFVLFNKLLFVHHHRENGDDSEQPIVLVPSK
jgi:putative flippase GtrA